MNIGADLKAGYAVAVESPAATAKPRVVASPATRPDFSVASGIIESTSITSSAPAAKPLIRAWKWPPVCVASR